MMRHPCFNAAASRHCGRVHLPVAPGCNLVCVYCERRTDCPNESRPGLASRVMSPLEAVEHLDETLKTLQHVSVVGIAGPGDPLATPELTLETLRLLRSRHSGLIPCLSTNGLALAEHVPELYALGVRHITLTINAIDPNIGGRIYRSVTYGGLSLCGEAGAALLQARQEIALKLLRKYGITVKINTVVIPGINDGHVESVAKYAACHGAALMNCLALIPIKGTSLGQIEPPDSWAMTKLRDSAEKHLPQMRHCGRCRADAAGFLPSDDRVPSPTPVAINAA